LEYIDHVPGGGNAKVTLLCLSFDEANGNFLF